MSEEKKEIVKQYSNKDITVIWKPNSCIHSKKCWKGLIQVFDPRNRPWINIDGASTDKIKKQVEGCPSGALSYISKGVENKEAISSETKIEVVKNGPLRVFGTLEVTKPDGTIEKKNKRTSFCRCGASQNQPYCDGAHSKSEFRG